MHENMPRSHKWPMGNILKNSRFGHDVTAVQAKLITDLSAKLVILKLSYSRLLQSRRKRCSELLQLKAVGVKFAVEKERMLSESNESEREVVNCRLITHGNNVGEAR